MPALRGSAVRHPRGVPQECDCIRPAAEVRTPVHVEMPPKEPRVQHLGKRRDVLREALHLFACEVRVDVRFTATEQKCAKVGQRDVSKSVHIRLIESHNMYLCDT